MQHYLSTSQELARSLSKGHSPLTFINYLLPNHLTKIARVRRATQFLERLATALWRRRLAAHLSAHLLWLALLCDLLARLLDRLGELLGLLDHLLDTRCLGLLELLGALLKRLLGALAECLCQVGLPQEEGLLEVDDLGEVSQHPGCEPIAGFHRLSVCPLGVRFEFLELVDGL